MIKVFDPAFKSSPDVDDFVEMLPIAEMDAIYTAYYFSAYNKRNTISYG
jgi:hypothetical protein